MCREAGQDVVLSLLEVESRRLKEDESKWRLKGDIGGDWKIFKETKGA